MGQKVNPNGIRLGIVKPWNSTWFANTQDFADNLDGDFKVRKFLNKEFYQRHKGFSFYDHHKSDNNIYYGYWSFEAGAVVKILRLDDTELKGVKYYPYDLVHYR